MDKPPAFDALPLPPALLQGVEALGYTTMTPVQAQALPPILEGRDLIAQAPTGSGKTAAFGLGLLQRLDATAVRTQALVLCPTRELAEQVGEQLRRLATGVSNVKLSVLCGGIPLAPQLASLSHAPHVVVGTPGRILELIGQGALQLSAGHAQMRGPHPVEALRGIEHRLRAAGRDVLDDGTHGGDRGLDVQLGTGQGRGELRCTQTARAQIDHGEEGGLRHGPSVGASRRPPPNRPRGARTSFQGSDLGRH